MTPTTPPTPALHQRADHHHRQQPDHHHLATDGLAADGPGHHHRLGPLGRGHRRCRGHGHLQPVFEQFPRRLCPRDLVDSVTADVTGGTVANGTFTGRGRWQLRAAGRLHR